jgi:hypothetical protein
MTESLNELSKRTLQRYSRLATKDHEGIQRVDYWRSKSGPRKDKNRAKYINLAQDKLKEDFDLDEELELLEAMGASSDKYYTHSNAHSMAFTKYAAAAKAAKESGNASHAKTLRTIGKKHKAAAEALAAIAGHHVDATYSRQQMVRKAMPAQPLKEDTDMEHEDNDFIEEDAVELEENEIVESDGIRDLIALAIDKRPVDFGHLVQEIIRERAAVIIEDLRIDVAEAFGSDPDEEEEEDDEDEINEISGKTLGSYIQKARKQDDNKRAHGREIAAHPSVKKHSDARSELIRQRVGYDSHGRSRNRSKIDTTYNKEAKAKDKLDPNWKKTTTPKRYRGIETAIKKLQYGKMTEDNIPPTGKTTHADKGANVSVGDQGPRTIKKVKFSPKKPEQVSVSVASADTIRSQEAAD